MCVCMCVCIERERETERQRERERADFKALVHAIVGAGRRSKTHRLETQMGFLCCRAEAELLFL